MFLALVGRVGAGSDGLAAVLRRRGRMAKLILVGVDKALQGLESMTV
jgi:hypothetical protein